MNKIVIVVLTALSTINDLGLAQRQPCPTDFNLCGWTLAGTFGYSQQDLLVAAAQGGVSVAGAYDSLYNCDSDGSIYWTQHCGSGSCDSGINGRTNAACKGSTAEPPPDDYDSSDADNSDDESDEEGSDNENAVPTSPRAAQKIHTRTSLYPSLRSSTLEEDEPTITVRITPPFATVASAVTVTVTSAKVEISETTASLVATAETSPLSAEIPPQTTLGTISVRTSQESPMTTLYTTIIGRPAPASWVILSAPRI